MQQLLAAGREASGSGAEIGKNTFQSFKKFKPFKSFSDKDADSKY